MPVDKWVEVGKTVSFNCKAININAQFWRRVGTDNIMFTGQSEQARMRVLTNGTLVISKVNNTITTFASSNIDNLHLQYIYRNKWLYCMEKLLRERHYFKYTLF